MLGMRTHLTPRDLKSDDRAEIGVIPFAKGGSHIQTHVTYTMDVGRMVFCSKREVLEPETRKSLPRTRW